LLIFFICISSDDFEQEVYKVNGISAIVTSMKRNVSKPRAQIMGCKALANLSHDGKCKNFTSIFQNLFFLCVYCVPMSHLLSLVQSHFSHLCVKDLIREAMGEEGGIDHIFTIMKRYESNPQVQVAAFNALINFSYDSGSSLSPSLSLSLSLSLSISLSLFLSLSVYLSLSLSHI